MNHLRLITALSALGTAGAFAQPPGPPPHEGRVFIRQMEGGGPGSGFHVEMGAESKIVKGAPYSAQAVSETTQTLADGTRIRRTTSPTPARATEGPTRRDDTRSARGPWPPARPGRAR